MGFNYKTFYGHCQPLPTLSNVCWQNWKPREMVESLKVALSLVFNFKIGCFANKEGKYKTQEPHSSRVEKVAQVSSG
jgi:hypothetical protein